MWRSVLKSISFDVVRYLKTQVPQWSSMKASIYLTYYLKMLENVFLSII